VIWEGKSNFEVLKDILRNVIVFNSSFWFVAGGLAPVQWWYQPCSDTIFDSY